jgi:phospholipid/cholesterol/gamma-HCH transport system substrate-binding protein
MRGTDCGGNRGNALARSEVVGATKACRGGKLRLVVVAVVVAVGAGILYFLKGPILAATAAGSEYHAAFSTVGGLRPGDEVRYGGLPVGRTRSVGIDPRDPSRIIVTFCVDQRTPMRTDTRASVVDVTSPVTRYLSLRPGSRSAPALPPGTEVATETGPTLEQTMLRLTVLLARADTMFDAAAPLLHGEFFTRLDRTTAQLDRITTAVVRSSARWGPGIERAARRLDTVVNRTDRLLAAVDSATPDLEASATEALGMLQDTRSLVAELRSGASEGGGFAELMRSLTTTSNDLSRVLAKLDRNPASLLHAQRSVPKTTGPTLPD